MRRGKGERRREPLRRWERLRRWRVPDAENGTDDASLRGSRLRPCSALSERGTIGGAGPSVPGARCTVSGGCEGGSNALSQHLA